MDTQALLWFVEIAHCGSFSEAARRLEEPSSNLSRRIAKLESELGERLLTRTTRALSLTDAGRQLLPLAEQMLTDQQAVLDWRDSQQEPNGTLRVTAPGSFARGPLTPWVIRYRQQYPNVQVELIHSNDYLSFQTHRLDFAFRQGPLPDSTLHAKRLFSIHYGVFVTPEWLSRYGPVTEIAQLNAHQVITTGAQGAVLPWWFQSGIWQPAQVSYLFDDFDQCLQAAAEGEGPTFASHYQAQPWLARGELVEVLADDRAEPMGFHLVYPSRSHRSRKSLTFQQHIEHEVRQFGPAEGLDLPL